MYLKPIFLFLSIFIFNNFSSSIFAQTAEDKAQKILEIARGISWKGSEDFIIGVLDAKEIDKALSNLAVSSKVANRTIQVKRYNFNFQVKPCDILFIGANSSSNTFFDAVLNKVKASPTLLITETKGMLNEGSHINFLSDGGKIKYEMNPQAIQNAGLQASNGLKQNAIQGNVIVVEEKSDNNLKVDLNKIFKKKENKESKNNEAETEIEEKPEEESARVIKRKKKNTKSTDKENTEEIVEVSPNLMGKIVDDKSKSGQQIDILKRYVAALEKKLDDNNINYQNLKSEYTEEQKKVEEEIALLNLIIVEKDSLRKKDAELAEKKIQLIDSEKKVAQAQAQTNLYIALLAISIAVGFFLIAFIFYRYNVLISGQRNQLSENLTEITKKNEEIQTQKEEIEAQRDKIEEESQKSDKLLLNILPAQIASELKEKGYASPQKYEMVSVLFTDFKGFTNLAELLTPEEVIQELEKCFSAFDEIVEKFGMERIKTIGDSYMCAGGVPIANNSNPIDAIRAGIEMQTYMAHWKEEKIKQGLPYFECRLGIHTGKVVAGVIGKKKFAYDIWGDTVNTASRMESSSEVNQVNISGETFKLVKDNFECEYRGKVNAKGKGEIDMYFVKQEKQIKNIT